MEEYIGLSNRYSNMGCPSSMPVHPFLPNIDLPPMNSPITSSPHRSLPRKRSSITSSPPKHRSLQRKPSRILTPKPNDNEAPVYDLSGIKISFASGINKFKKDEIMEDEVEVEGREIPRRVLHDSNETLQWAAPPNLRTPLTGIYQSGWVRSEHLNYLSTLKLKTIVCVATTPPLHLAHFLERSGIQFYFLHMRHAPQGISDQAMQDAMYVLLKKELHPILVFSRLGKHRVGCVMALLRRITSDWNNEAVIEEYKRGAGAQSRDADIKYISGADVSAFGTAFRGVFEANAEFDAEFLQILSHTQGISQLGAPVPDMSPELLTIPE